MIIIYKNYKINCKYIGIKSSPCDVQNRNQNVMIITNLSTGKWISIDVWGTDDAPEIYSRQDVARAFDAFLLYAKAGKLPLEEFCMNFGRKMSRNTKIEYKTCRKLAKKLDVLMN